MQILDIPGLLALIQTPRYKQKTRGELRTPAALINEILDQIPQDIWRRGGAFLDPSCGRGGFLVAMADRLLKYHSADAVAKMLHAVDIDTYCVYATKLVLADMLAQDPEQIQVHQHDFLDWNPDMRFDVIVGNPPYQDAHSDGGRRDQASNLWSRFWSESFRRLAPGGSVCLITPTTWCSPSADLRGADRIQGHDRLWEVFSQYTSRARVEGVADHFPGVGSSFGYVWVDTSGDAGLTFNPPRPTDLGFLPVSGQDRVAAELDPHDNLGQHFTINQDNSPDLRVSIPMTRVLEDPSIEILQGQCDPQAGSSRAQLYLYVHVNTPEQAQAVRERIVSCLDILNRHCRWSGFLNIQAVRRISY